MSETNSSVPAAGTPTAAFYEIDPAKMSREGMKLLGKYEMLDKWIAVLIGHASQPATAIVESAILKKIANSLAMDLEKVKVALAAESVRTKAATVHEAPSEELQGE